MFAPYRYEKESPKKFTRRSWNFDMYNSLKSKNIQQIVSTIFILSGFFLLSSQIVIPLLTAPSNEPMLHPLAPIDQSKVLASETSQDVIKTTEFTELAFATTSATTSLTPVPAVFYLSIPKLNISGVEVETNSHTLSPDKRLGHYAGSALPGQPGNSFIYGHSALPIFFNSSDYRTIFSNLDKLTDGDEILIDYDNQQIKYRVESQTTLEPKDVHPLDPVSPAFLQQSYVTLMTCVPPGLDTKRLLVYARRVT